MPEEASVEVCERDGAAVIELQGSIDVSAASQLRDAGQNTMDSAGGAVVDFSRAERLDSSALQVLLALDFALKRSGRSLRTRGLDENIRAYLRLCGAENAFEETRD